MLKALDQERKKLKNLSIIQAKENQQLIKKIQILERSNLNNPQANLPNEEILEQLQQINHELFSKSQKTSDFRGVESKSFFHFLVI